MAKELQFEFHNPNSDAITANFLLELFFEANRERVGKIIKDSLQMVHFGNASAEDAKYSV